MSSDAEADDADDRLPQAAEDETYIASAGVDSELGDDEATVLTTSDALKTDEFPQGLSPRELALTLKGQLLGHFHLQEFIGGGGMGAVFKALDTTLDRIVAVKVVASQSVSSEDLQRRFLVEAQSTARLDHPNIARIHFVGRDRGLPYIVFEYIEGVNLRDLVVNHGPMPVGDALSFTCQIAHALAHAWQKEVVHRDIKPSNILITQEGQAKLVDMGLARLKQVDTAEDDLTSTGITLGTFDYISPEQARDPREADTRSDIYSLGCTLFYMLIGRPPFADGTAVQKLLKHQDQSPPELSQLRSEIPVSVSQLAASMLEKSPDRRPQTPSEVVRTCYRIFQELGIQPPASLAPLPAVSTATNSPAWRKHLPWAIPVAGLLLLSSVWQGTAPDPGDRVEFQPIRRPVSPPAEPSIQIELSEPETSESFSGSLRIDESGSSQASFSLEGGIVGEMSESPAFEDSQPFAGSLFDGGSLLDFPSGPVEAEDNSDRTDDGFNFDDFFAPE